MPKEKFIDLVITGCDFSGSSSQTRGLANYLESKGKIVRDLRGTEIDALFHAEKFSKINQDHRSAESFLQDKKIWDIKKYDFLFHVYDLLSGISNSGLQIASFVKNNSSTYINPDSADVWLMEEPTRRGAGQVNRAIEQNRSQYKDSLNPVAAALSHQAYRTDEFLRFRKPLRENGKTIIRSRSEESAAYQIKDLENLPNGISEEEYLNLPGHEIAFSNPPTHIFVMNGPANWKAKDYKKLKRKRQGNRAHVDDHESNIGYQLLVNRRYATDWLENLYEKGCKIYGGTPPKIERFNIYDSKGSITEQMSNKLERIMKE